MVQPAIDASPSGAGVYDDDDDDGACVGHLY
jgi:hypothetical protein